MAGNLSLPDRLFDSKLAYEIEGGWMLFDVKLKVKQGPYKKGDTFAAVLLSLDMMNNRYFKEVGQVNMELSFSEVT